MGLSVFDILNGTMSIIYVIISILVGLKIASRYIEKKQRVFLFVGLSWVGLSAPWFPSTLSFSLSFFSIQLPPEFLFTIANVPISIALILWMTAFTDLKYRSKQKFIIGILIIYALIYNSIFFYLLFTDSTQIGKIEGLTDTSYKLIVNINMILSLLILLITGTIFSLESIKSDDREVNLKGKFLLAAFYFFIIGAVLDVLSTISIWFLIIGRIFLIIGAIEFYIGFILPKFIKNIVL
ncbi:MAG: hypothetical protein GF317_18045 [Candidatus Lokiarchaeota archaeon]|nr:hypothetical protein [Candidatus Lokiarchaeota archaeon]MBD3201415.1 hypothetical protein [Candidatus Lokiarchaeota archaeon]